MNYVKEEKDLNLKELFLDVISKWRSIILFGIIAMFFVVLINLPGTIKFRSILGNGVVIKELIKYSVLAFVGMMAVSTCFYVFKHMFSDKIKSVNDYNLSCNLKLLGVIPNEVSRRNLLIDRIIKKAKGIKITSSSREKFIERIANVILAEVQLRNNTVCTVAIVTSNTENVSSECVELLNEKIAKERIELVSAGDIWTSEKAINIVTQADYIIIVERQGESKYSEFEQTCKQIGSLNKEILGTVLMDVEAI